MQLCPKTETEPRGGTLRQPHRVTGQEATQMQHVLQCGLQWNVVAMKRILADSLQFYIVFIKFYNRCPLFPQKDSRSLLTGALPLAVLTPGLHQVQLSFLKALSKRLAFASSLANTLVLTMSMAEQRAQASKTRIEISLPGSSWPSFIASERKIFSS